MNQTPLLKYVFLGVVVLAVLFATIGTGVPVFFRNAGNCLQEVSLWTINDICISSSNMMTIAGSGFCTSRQSMFFTGSAFAIITIFFTTLAIITGILALRCEWSVQILAIVFTVCGFIAAFVTVAIEAALFHREYCNGQLGFNLTHQYGASLPLFVVAGFLDLVGAVVAGLGL